VYVLCAATALACAILLMRGYRKSRTGLLLWSALCFAGLTLANVLLVVDLMIVPSEDLSLLRSALTLLSGIVLLYGLVSETAS
jgi:hypothetical protein